MQYSEGLALNTLHDMCDSHYWSRLVVHSFPLSDGIVGFDCSLSPVMYTLNGLANSDTSYMAVEQPSVP